MRDALHTILVANRFERRLDVLIAAVIAVGTFVMYATGGFSVDVASSSCLQMRRLSAPSRLQGSATDAAASSARG